MRTDTHVLVNTQQIYRRFSYRCSTSTYVHAWVCVRGCMIIVNARYSPAIYISSRGRNRHSRRLFLADLSFPRKIAARLLHLRPFIDIRGIRLSVRSPSLDLCADFERDMQPGGKRIPIEDIYHRHCLANENISHLGRCTLSRRVSQI